MASTKKRIGDATAAAEWVAVGALTPWVKNVAVALERMTESGCTPRKIEPDGKLRKARHAES
jgi:hypothetical protein